jgi:ATP/maltotriose-dependent transcriptional regulator MalT
LNVAETLAVLARIEAHEGKYATADALCEESLTLAKEVGDKTLIAFSLEGMASVLAARGEPTLAAQLWGTGESLRETIGAPIPPFWRSDYSSSVALARGQLGERDFAVAWAEGRTLTPEQALAVQDQATMALHIPSRRPPTPLVKSPSTYPNDLTAREVEVLRLVAQGWADTQISEHLVISPRTVNTHLTSIFRKIEVTSRSAATRYAFEHKLV